MALDDIIRSGIVLAKTITEPLQVQVSHSSYTGQDGTGTPTFSAAVNRPAIVEQKLRYRQSSSSGRLILTKSKVTFMTPVTVDSRDKIVLPDGSSDPILDIEGVVDPDTSRPYLTEIWLGDSSQ